MSRMTRARLLPLCLVAVACAQPTTPVQPTPEPWSPPTWEGDGLPASEGTEHQTGDAATPPQSTPTPGDGGEDGPTVKIEPITGVFAVTTDPESLLQSGTLDLLVKELGCYDVFGAVDTGATSDGIYLTLLPAYDEEAQPVWEGTYEECRSGPPCFRGYAVADGSSEELGRRAWVTVTRLDAHYVTVSWETDVSSGTDLTFYHCGVAASWAY